MSGVVKNEQKFASSPTLQPFNRIPQGRSKLVSESRMPPSSSSSTPQCENTELECGHLSSCSDSEDSSSEETLDIVLNGDGGASGGRECTGEMNDVDDEYLAGENDVSFINAIPSLPTVSLPEIDSLTYTEPSMESMTSLTSATKTPTHTSLTTTTVPTSAGSSSHLSLEDEMLLFRLMSLREGNASRVPTALRQPSTSLVDSTPQKIQNTRQAELDNLYPDDGQTSIAPLPSFGNIAMSEKSTNSKKTSAVSSAAGTSTSTVPLPSLSTPGHDR